MSDKAICVFCAGEPTEGLIVLFEGIGERPVCRRCLNGTLRLDKRVSAGLAGLGMRLLMCRNCRHWEAGAAGPGYREGEKWGWCERTGEEPKGEDMMFVGVENGDYPDSYSVVKTREDFGCVMFEAKGGE